MEEAQEMRLHLPFRGAVSTKAPRSGFTLLEVMIATIILSAGLVVLLTSFMQCQRVMNGAQDFENAQYVLALGETAFPLPSADQVEDTGDAIFDNELLVIEPVTVSDMLEDLGMPDLPRDRMMQLEGYTFERSVDEIDDEELQRSGYLYTIRTVVSWGSDRHGRDKDKVTVLTLWRKQQ